MFRPLSIVLWMLSARADAATFEVQADTMRWTASAGWTAEGVTLSQEGTEITASRLEWTSDTEELTLYDGQVRLANGNALAFQQATASATHVTLLQASGPMAPTHIEAAQLVLTQDTQEARQLTVDLCSPCTGASPVSIQTQRARLEDDTLYSGPGWLRLFDVPLVPVPAARVPLGRQSGLLPTQVRTGDWGVAVAQPLYLTHGRGADTTWTPEVRSAWGTRLLQQTRWAHRTGGGHAELAGGWDNLRGLGGLADWQVRHGGPGWTLATEGQWSSSSRYRADYGDGWLDRNLPFQEQRTLTSWGPQSVDLWHADGTPLHARQLLRLPATDLPAGLRLRGQQSLELVDRRLDGSMDLLADRPIDLTPVLLLSPGLRLHATPQAQHGFAVLDTTLRLWRKQNGRLERVLPGIHLAWGSSAQGGRQLEVAPRWRYRVTTARSQTLLEAGWLWTEHRSEGGWMLWRNQSDHLVTQLQVDNIRPDALPDQISPRLGWIHGRFRADVASTWTESQTETWGTAWVPVPGLRGTLRLLAETRLEDTRSLRNAGGIEYTHPSRCLRLSATAGTDLDRRLPTVAAQLDLYPKPPPGLR